MTKLSALRSCGFAEVGRDFDWSSPKQLAEVWSVDKRAKAGKVVGRADTTEFTEYSLCPH
eukprot:6199410-Pleurochrysis_carterae.AAC.3